ncbi:MAG: lipid A biosynthesis acyltransferase [Verrucomicrobia bacterium]|nr:lipid A biosynthesis acyltransferase [Verrucomicrobiota bacterium]
MPNNRSVIRRIGYALEYSATWIGLGILWLLIQLPVRWQQRIGTGFGELFYRLFPYRKRIGSINLRICFPNLTDRQRAQLLRRHYHAMGIGVLEMALAWWGKHGSFSGIGTVEGLEHLHAARENGRGVILLTAHFTTLELCGRILNETELFSCLYRKPNNPVLEKFMTRARARLMRRVIHFDDMVAFIRALKDGETIWYAPDQGKSFKYTALLPFFGEPAITNTATARIASMTGAAIVPYFGFRKPDGSYHVSISPALDNIPSGNWEADATEINRVIEGFVRTAPEQYFWLHKRFKARGPNLPDVYANS